MKLVELLTSEIGKAFPSRVIGFAWNSKVASGEEDIPEGWETGNLVGLRVDFAEDITESEKAQIRTRIAESIANKDQIEAQEAESQRLIINSANAAKLVELLISKGLMTQEEVTNALVS